MTPSDSMTGPERFDSICPRRLARRWRRVASRNRASSNASMPKAFTTRCPRHDSETRLARSAVRSCVRWLVLRMLLLKRTIG